MGKLSFFRLILHNLAVFNTNQAVFAIKLFDNAALLYGETDNPLSIYFMLSL